MSAAISKTKKIMAMRMRKKIISAYVCLGWTIRVRPMSAAISMTKKKMAMRMKMTMTVPISAYVCLGWTIRVKLVKRVQPLMNRHQDEGIFQTIQGEEERLQAYRSQAGKAHITPAP